MFGWCCSPRFGFGLRCAVLRSTARPACFPRAYSRAQPPSHVPRESTHRTRVMRASLALPARRRRSLARWLALRAFSNAGHHCRALLRCFLRGAIVYSRSRIRCGLTIRSRRPSCVLAITHCTARRLNSSVSSHEYKTRRVSAARSLVCIHAAVAVDSGEAVGFFWNNNTDLARPDAWCKACEVQLAREGWSKAWSNAANFKFFCECCWDLAKERLSGEPTSVPLG